MTKGVIILAVFSFVISATVFSFMIYTIVLEERLHITKPTMIMDGKNDFSHHHIFSLHLDRTTIKLIVSFILLISFLEMIFSILLIIGIKKNKPSLVVTYFSFGCFLCLLLLVTAVLQLVQSLCYPAIRSIVIAIIFTRQLSVVYSVYENMEKDSEGNLFLETDDLSESELGVNIIPE